MRRGPRHHGPDSPQARKRAERIARIHAMRAEGLTQREMAEALHLAPKTLANFAEMFARPMLATQERA